MFFYASGLNILQANSQGQGLVMVAPADGYPEEASARPESEWPMIDATGIYVPEVSLIQDVADLASKTIAAPTLQGQPDATVAYGLLQEGLDPQSVDWIQLDYASSLSALERLLAAASDDDGGVLIGDDVDR